MPAVKQPDLTESLARILVLEYKERALRETEKLDSHLAVFCTLHDYCTRHISNWLPVPAFLAAWSLALWLGGSGQLVLTFAVFEMSVIIPGLRGLDCRPFCRSFP